MNKAIGFGLLGLGLGCFVFGPMFLFYYAIYWVITAGIAILVTISL